MVPSKFQLFISLLMSLEPALWSQPKAPTHQPVRLLISPEVRVGEDLGDLPHVEPVIAVNPQDGNHLVVACLVVQRPLSEEFPDSWTVHVLASRDGGKTWKRHRLPGLEHRLAGDPWLGWSSKGTLYLSCLVRLRGAQGRIRMRVWLYRSVDGGREWSNPLELPFGLAGSLDHPVLDVSNEDVVVFATGGLSSISVSRGKAGDDTFEPLPPFRPDALNNNLGSGIAVPSHRLIFSYFSMSRRHPSPLWAIRSIDGGRTYERCSHYIGAHPRWLPAHEHRSLQWAQAASDLQCVGALRCEALRDARLLGRSGCFLV